jgi:hypothetical protein
MTPQERELVADLFDRLATLEREPRDREAERVIRDGVSRAPNAVYALVQSVLVQDEALKQADARIRELEAELYGPAESGREPGSFLDNMREALLGGGRAQASGSVPTVHPQGRPMGAPPQSGQPQSEAMAGRGGSFLGTAGAAAAGMIGGGLLLGDPRDARRPKSGAVRRYLRPDRRRRAIALGKRSRGRRPCAFGGDR